MEDHVLSVHDLVKVDLDPVRVDAALVKAPEFADPNADTVDQRRLRFLNANYPLVTSAIAKQNDPELKLNQQKLDALLQPETAHSASMIRIDSEVKQFKASVRQTFGLQEITFEAAKSATLIGIVGQILPVLAAHDSKLAKTQQAIAIATITYDTARAVARAYAELSIPGEHRRCSQREIDGRRTDRQGEGLKLQRQQRLGRPRRPITGEAVYRWLVDNLRQHVGDFELVLQPAGDDLVGEA
jgi:hypothetical protein